MGWVDCTMIHLSAVSEETSRTSEENTLLSCFLAGFNLPEEQFVTSQLAHFKTTKELLI